MKRLRITAVLIVCLLAGVLVNAQKMNNRKIDRIFRAECERLEGSAGVWQFRYMDRPMFCFTDRTLNRMRIICPIALVEKLDEGVVYDAMTANFHSALDVKYAISDEIMWSVFIHPFRELSTRQVKDALHQLFMAAHTFGTTYSSTDHDLPFSGDRKAGQEDSVPSSKM